MPPRAIVFDLFHTLTGLESEWSDLPWTSDVLGIDRAVWNTALTVQSRWRVAGEERDPYRIVERLARAIDPSITDETLRRAVEVRIARFRHSLCKVPPANVGTLRRLRAAGFRLGLVSNADAMEVAAWPDSPLAGLFDVEVFSCMAGCVKPEPAIFAKCLDALGVSAADSMFVGDGSSDELAGAKSIGMRTVLVSGVIRQLWPEKIPERAAIADHHLAWVPEILVLLGLAPGEALAQVRASERQAG
ncbi:MAG TPA: HAD family hydrolase [Burkholderiales bacterium]|jgi:putative hydrolase of the HAD superfamily|nr:HAD family hydrolase [Burkholderiales bacterium]